jgi:hypothetical protein
VSTDSRTEQAVDGTALVGVAVDPRQSPPTVSVWITPPNGVTQGLNLSPSAARSMAARLIRAADEIDARD